MAKLRTHVHVHVKNKAGEYQSQVLEPGQDVPKWAEGLITNPDAWLEPPTGGEHPSRGDQSQGSR